MESVDGHGALRPAGGRGARLAVRHWDGDSSSQAWTVCPGALPTQRDVLGGGSSLSRHVSHGT